MLIGTSVFAYVVGSVCTIVASMDKKNSDHMELMDTLNAMTRELNLETELKVEPGRYCPPRHRPPTRISNPRLLR